MTVRAEFNGPFNGIVFSKGTFGQDNCVYVKPYSGVTHTTFKVQYDACGTKPDLQGKYYENTIVIQYGVDIIEAWDEAKRLRCEWFEAYEKPATFRPAIPVADLDVIEMNFQGDDIDCWMEIQEGKGPWAREVNRIVPVGQPMTIVVSINDFSGQFDMRVKSCFAHDGIKPPIQLTDEHGCVLRPKMLSSFQKIKDPNGKATVISYSHFYAFKFPDTMNVQIQCTVEVCRHGCPDACQKGPYPTPVREIHPKVQLGTAPNNQPRIKPEEEPKPVYQDVGASSKIPSLLIPGINDPNVLNHATQFLADQGVDLNKLRQSFAQQHNQQAPISPSSDPQPAFIPELISPFGDESREQPLFASPNASSSSSSLTNSDESDDKPVIKVVEINVPNDKKKAPTISETNSLFPSDLNQANKILADLGLNMDLNQFASSLTKNNKDLQSLLQSDSIKQIASATGLNLNAAASSIVPDAQPLVNLTSGILSSFGSNVDLESLMTTKVPGPLNEPETENPIQIVQPIVVPIKVNSNGTASVGNTQGSSSAKVHHHHHHHHSHSHAHGSTQQQQQQQHHQQQQQQQRPSQQSTVYRQPSQPHIPISPAPHGQQQAPIRHHGPHPHPPVVQVLSIPMHPGLGPNSLPPVPPPSGPGPLFPNFVPLPPHLTLPPPPKAKRPLFTIPSFHLPSLSSLNPFANHFSHSKDRKDDSIVVDSMDSMVQQPRSGIVAGSDQGPHFPQGPRALRLRRSTRNKSSSGSNSNENTSVVHKGFQVVTSMDLAFNPNLTGDDLNAQIYDGRREEIVYGVCMPMMSFTAIVTVSVLIILAALVFSIFMVHRINRRSKGKF